MTPEGQPVIHLERGIIGWRWETTRYYPDDHPAGIRSETYYGWSLTRRRAMHNARNAYDDLYESDLAEPAAWIRNDDFEPGS